MIHRFALLPWIVSLAASPGFAQEKPTTAALEQNAALIYWQAFALMPKLTDAEKDLLGPLQVGERAFTDEDRKILQRADDALRYLHRGAKMERAVWGVTWDQGPHALLPHLAQAKELFRLAELRARLRFEEGQHKEALDDLFAAMRMGRHLSRDGVIVLIPLLVNYALDAVCVGTIAEHLPEMDTKTRVDLKRRLAELPPSRSLTDAVQGEKDVFLTWLIAEVKKPNPKERVLDFVGKVPDEEVEAFKKLDESELLPATRRMGEYFDRMIADVKLPPDEVQKRYERMNQEFKNNGAKDLLSHWLFPHLHAGRRAEATHRTRLALLGAGIAVLEEGEMALKAPEHHDPFGDGPFEYKETDSGFVLTSAWEHPRGVKVSITFGKK
jgi:hypothetical protein